ncbi:DUF433 domain-containing protein [uncultured Thiodictyon sp.]|uniref:DUF433 domain-containing protein n=1 Tax=uncultured Thiodictyon sp. TaxID=1846217 RepID=UPI0025DF7320|nr:DUF433 domain-containing protein [uncultured Thiodictyon sp.]
MIIDADVVPLEYLDGRITVHPDLCNGRPTIRGLRITVDTILGLLRAGESPDEILRQYPSLEPADIDACVRFVAQLTAPRSEAGECGIFPFGEVQIEPDYDYKALRR